ncbi:transposase [Caballeronia sp. LZ035]|uniref:transposase n=1 Tax=Caballeronia sp. LZ035 TaxID=3038568 RepID=UPI0038D456E1
MKCGRDFAASLGLMPRQHSTGGRGTLPGISKRGNEHSRGVLVRGDWHAALCRLANGCAGRSQRMLGTRSSGSTVRVKCAADS